MSKSGSFVTIAYNYAIWSSNSKKYKKRLDALVTKVIDQTNIVIHYTKAISKCWFRTTQDDIDTVQGKDIHAIPPCPVLRRRVNEFEKDMLICFSLTYFLHIIWILCLQMDMTQIL